MGHAAATLVLEVAQRSAAERGRFLLALSGGTTPSKLYSALASPAYAEQMPWELTHLFWSDERWVPLDDPASNAGLGLRELVAKVPIPPSQVHPLVDIAFTPQESAERYEGMLREVAGTERPQLDLVLLGLGTDGHTASLFPGTLGLGERDRLVVANHVPQLETWRLTFTLTLINEARSVLFLVTGTEKARALRQVLSPQPETVVLPGSMVRPTSGNITWMVDQDAASLLPKDL